MGDLWHCFTMLAASITSLYGNIFKYKTINPDRWRLLLHGHGDGCVQLAQVPHHLTISVRIFSWFHGISASFMGFHRGLKPSNVYETYGNVRQHVIWNNLWWLVDDDTGLYDPEHCGFHSMSWEMLCSWETHHADWAGRLHEAPKSTRMRSPKVMVARGKSHPVLW